jgi:hypothetical protein
VGIYGAGWFAGWLECGACTISRLNFQTAGTVIASEAKQSISPHKERMNCFAALAMTCNPDTVIPGSMLRIAPE